MTSRAMLFPPRGAHIVLPSGERPARAALHALTAELTLREVLLVEAAQRSVAAGAGRLLRRRVRVALPDPEAFSAWCAEVAEPLVGPVSAVAYSVPSATRTYALLLGRDGAPIGFAKLRDAAEVDEVEPRVLRLLDPPPETFRTPRLLSEGTVDGRHIRLMEPLPEGRHRRPPHHPTQLFRIVDEVQERLGGLPGRGEAARAHPGADELRPGQGDLTPRNLRVAADGRWWLFDWEYAGWMPRLADELRYWITDAASRPRWHRHTTPEAVLARLQRRGDPAQISAALAWPEHEQPRERDLRRRLQALHDGGRR